MVIDTDNWRQNQKTFVRGGVGSGMTGAIVVNMSSGSRWLPPWLPRPTIVSTHFRVSAWSYCGRGSRMLRARLPGRGDLVPAVEQPEAASATAAQDLARLRRAPAPAVRVSAGPRLPAGDRADPPLAQDRLREGGQDVADRIPQDRVHVLVVGGGLGVDDDHLGPAAQRQVDQAGDRVHLQRGTDRDQHVQL